MFSLLATVAMLCFAETEMDKASFSVKNITHGVITEKLKESRDFYVNHLDFKVAFENEWYIHLHAQADSRFQIAFLLPNHPSQPPVFQPTFGGQGLFYTLEVDNVDALYARLKSAGVKIAFPLTDEPWGERHFAFYDPSGVALNVSQPTQTIEKEYRDGFKEGASEDAH